MDIVNQSDAEILALRARLIELNDANQVLGARVARYQTVLKVMVRDKTTLADVLARDCLKEFGVEANG